METTTNAIPVETFRTALKLSLEEAFENVHGFFLDKGDLAGLRDLAQRSWKPEALALGAAAAYLWCAGGILESPLLTAVSRAVKDGLTTRNWATVTKIHALL